MAGGWLKGGVGFLLDFQRLGDRKALLEGEGSKDKAWAASASKAWAASASKAWAASAFKAWAASAFKALAASAFKAWAASASKAWAAEYDASTQPFLETASQGQDILNLDKSKPQTFEPSKTLNSELLPSTVQVSPFVCRRL